MCSNCAGDYEDHEVTAEDSGVELEPIEIDEAGCPTLEGSLVSYLIFCSYRANRGYGMSAEQLAGIFGAGQGARMEERYEAERSK